MRRKIPPAPRAAEDITAETSTPAPPAGEVVSGLPECGMTEDLWSGLPHWSCTKCRFETLSKTEADRHVNACSATKPGG